MSLPHTSLLARIIHTLNILLLLCVICVPLIVWEPHFHLFERMKEFIFLATVLLLTGILVVLSLFYKLPLWQNSRLSWAVLAYSLYHTGIFLFFPYAEKRSFVRLIGVILLFYILSAITTIKHRDRILQGSIVVALLSGVYGCLQFFSIPPFQRFGDYFGSKTTLGNRIFTTFGHPNLLGGFFVVMLPVLVVFFLHALQERRVLRSIYLGGTLALSGLALLMSQTRGAWISAALSLGWLTLHLWRTCAHRRFSRVRRLHCLSLLLIIIITGVCGGYLLINHSSLFDNTSFRFRIAYYKTTWQMIGEKPVFGHGLGTFSVYYPLYRDMRAAALLGDEAVYSWLEHPHNEHLEILHEGGIVGYALFIWMVGEALVALLRRNTLVASGLAAALLGLLIDGLYSQNLRSIVILLFFWLILGFANIPETPGIAHARFPGTQRNGLQMATGGGILLVLGVLFYSAYGAMHADFYIKAGKRTLAVHMPHIAVTWFHKASILDGTNVFVLYELARCYEELRNTAEALQYYGRLHQLHPSFRDVNFRLGKLYEEDGQLTQAKHYFEQHLAVNNAHWFSYYHLVEIEHAQGHNEQARYYLEEILHITELPTIPKPSDEILQEIRLTLQQQP